MVRHWGRECEKEKHEWDFPFLKLPLSQSLSPTVLFRIPTTLGSFLRTAQIKVPELQKIKIIIKIGKKRNKDASLLFVNAKQL